ADILSMAAWRPCALIGVHASAVPLARGDRMRSLAEASLTLVSDAEQPLSKREIRRRVISARTSLAVEECAARAIRIGKRAVALVDARGATTVSAYVSIDGEPGTDPLIDTLHESGI